MSAWEILMALVAGLFVIGLILSWKIYFERVWELRKCIDNQEVELEGLRSESLSCKPRVAETRQPYSLPLSLLTPSAWQSDHARTNYVKGLLTQLYFRDLLAVIQGTTIVPPLSGFEAHYELGKVHGLKLAVSLVLQMSHPEGDAPSQPRADYGAEAEALRTGVLQKPLPDGDTSLDDGWEPIPQEENLES